MVYLSDRGMLPAGLGPTILVVRDLETGQEHSPAPDLRRVLAPRWHPDGRNLVVEALDPDSRWGIYTIDVDTAAVEPMVTWDRPSCGCAAAPALSPDGRFLAYYRPQLQEGKGDLVLRNVDSREETVLMMGASPANVRALSFAPDGTVLAAAIRRGDADQPASWILEFISLTTGERRDITTLGTSPQGVDVIGWTADGSGALYVRADDDRHSLGWAGRGWSNSHSGGRAAARSARHPAAPARRPTGVLRRSAPGRDLDAGEPAGDTLRHPLVSCNRGSLHLAGSRWGPEIKPSSLFVTYTSWGRHRRRADRSGL